MIRAEYEMKSMIKKSINGRSIVILHHFAWCRLCSRPKLQSTLFAPTPRKKVYGRWKQKNRSQNDRKYEEMRRENIKMPVKRRKKAGAIAVPPNVGVTADYALTGALVDCDASSAARRFLISSFCLSQISSHRGIISDCCGCASSFACCCIR